MRILVESVALIGPGLPDWQGSLAVLRGEAPYGALSPASAAVVATPQRLPAAERRRVGLSVKLAIAVAEQAFAGWPDRMASTATVFTSSGGDGDNCHALCEALTATEPMVSPTRFTNSVHNAAAGYWSIAVGATGPSSSLCAFDASFCAGLIEAAMFAVAEQEPVALIAYDVRYPEPLHSKRPITAAFGAALILAPASVGAAAGRRTGLATLELAEYSQGSGDRLADPALEALRVGVPAARCLPLLAAIAGQRPAGVSLDAFPGQVLRIEVLPCG